MNALNERRSQDLEKIRKICDGSGGKIRILSTKGNPVNQIELALHLKTVPSKGYPKDIQEDTRVMIELSNRYPFQEPLATITTKIFHPNVYSSGRICFGTKWIPTEGLDLLLKRIIQITTYDPLILNPNSPANREALLWYQQTVRKYPTMFPTDNFSTRINEVKKTLSWNNIK